MKSIGSRSSGSSKSIIDVIRPLDNELVEQTVGGLHDALAKRLQSWINLDAPVLDLGCGSGAWLKRLADLGFKDLTGTDANIGQIRTDVGKFIQMDLDKCDPWKITSQKYMMITAIEVIEHLTNMGHFLSEASRLLHPNGFLLITTPNIHSLACRMRFFLTGSLKQFGTIGDYNHIFPVILDTFPRVIVKYNLELVEIWGYPEDGRTLTSRNFVNFVARFLRMIIPEIVPGDSMCILMQKRKKVT